MEEIEEVVGDKTTVEADDLDKLTYMNQVNLYMSITIKFAMTIFLHFSWVSLKRKIEPIHFILQQNLYPKKLMSKSNFCHLFIIIFHFLF